MREKKELQCTYIYTELTESLFHDITIIYRAEPAKYLAMRLVSDMSSVAETTSESTFMYRRANPAPPVPTERSGYDIPDACFITPDRRHDTGNDDPNRIFYAKGLGNYYTSTTLVL